jgi:hypothetical protein
MRLNTIAIGSAISLTVAAGSTASPLRSGVADGPFRYESKRGSESRGGSLLARDQSFQFPVIPPRPPSGLGYTEYPSSEKMDLYASSRSARASLNRVGWATLLPSASFASR